MAESTKNMTVGAGNASASVTATVTDRMPGVPCPTSPGYEYTGMRYVPVFADPPEWSSANSYEPLEIVIHEGNSYTSKTFVPVGIDISNSAYWALTGNYNAQVEQYRQEVQKFDGRIAKNAEDIAVNTADIANLAEKTSSLAHSKEFKGSNILYVTDSWGVKTTGVTKPYVNSLGDILGANLTSLSVGSTGYISGGTNNFINRLKAWADANPGKTGDIDYVMVCGSSNDYPHTTSEIAAAVNQFVSYALSAFPNAQVVVIPQFASNKPAYASVDTTDDNLWRKVNAAATVAYYNNSWPRTRFIPYTFYALAFTPASFMSSDNIHPTQSGHDYLAKWLSEALLGVSNSSNITYTLPQETTFTTHDNAGAVVETITNATSVSVTLSIVNGVLCGSVSFGFKPTKPAVSIRMNTPAFVLLNTQVGFSWGTVVSVGVDNAFNRSSIRFGDMKGKTLPASGANAWIEFGALTPYMKTGNSLIVSANISIPVSYVVMSN